MRKDVLLNIMKSDKLVQQIGAAQLKCIGIKGSRRIATRLSLLALPAFTAIEN